MKQVMCFLALLILGISPTTVSGQNDTLRWVFQGKIVNQTLWAVHFTDTLHGWAAGNRGAVVRTVDGGVNWTVCTGPTGDSLYTVWFAGNARGWMAGARGIIHTSVDSGKTWTAQLNPAQTYFTASWFFNDSVGVIGGSSNYKGVIYHTVNGGANWTSVSVNYPSNVESFCFIDPLKGWASGMDYVIASQTGGTAWSAAVDPVASGYRGYVNTVWFLDPLNGFGVGRYGGIVRTVNGGQNWAYADTASSSWLEDVTFADSLHGVIVGERGMIAWSNNRGATWRRGYPRQQPTLNASWFRSVYACDARHLWTAGDSGIIMRGSFMQPATGVRPVPALRSMPVRRIISLKSAHPAVYAVSGAAGTGVYDLNGRMRALVRGSALQMNPSR